MSMKKTSNYYKFYLELKNRLFLLLLCWATSILVCYHYKNFLLFSVIKNIETLSGKTYLIFTDITEIFYVYLQLIIFISNQISFIFIIYHLLTFLALGFFKHELKIFKTFFKIFLILMIISILIFYKFIIPLSGQFFLTFQQNNTILQPISFFFEAKLLDFLNYFIKFYNLCFFSCHFLLVVLYFTSEIINKKKQIKVFRKIFYLIFLIFSTFISPPDVLSQLIITLYLIIIYEILIFINFFKIN